MFEPKCAICGKPATIHDTLIEARAATSRHFCPEHAEPSLPPVFRGSQADAMKALEEYYHSLSDSERENMALLNRLSKLGGRAFFSD
jgi:hypothetical protein